MSRGIESECKIFEEDSHMARKIISLVVLLISFATVSPAHGQQ